MKGEDIIRDIEKKYLFAGENPDTYLKGLLHAKPLTYWDYVEVETLLSLQRPRTDFKDEVVFILYHQVTELVLKMMLHEIRQLVDDDLDEMVWVDKVNRLIRYTSLLINSFDIMRSGMNHSDYNLFRNSLAPASGFQSVQFRYIEIYATRLENLVSAPHKQPLGDSPTVEECFRHIYWRDAGSLKRKGKTSVMLQLFEEKYLNDLIDLAKKVRGSTLEEKVMRMKHPSSELIDCLRRFDNLYNVEWPKVHLKTAAHYLDGPDGTKEATGGSAWKEYLHPKYQQRKFFPLLWSEKEKQEWGND